MKIVLYMNCWGREIKSYFNHYYKDIEIIHIITYELIDNNLPIPTNILSNADYLIYNPIKSKHGIYCINNIINYISNNTKILSIAYYRFDFMFCFTSSCHNACLSENTNIFVSDSIKNLNLDFCINPSMIKCDHSKRFKYSVEQLDKFDKMSDIKLGKFILDNYKSIKLFSDPSHPTAPFF